ncbi:MAG TPA: hypothetical protein PL135_04780, partial [Spirochaetota bacterium]|nr:hypothetical protein [Spirochaetota bacterium]
MDIRAWMPIRAHSEHPRHTAMPSRKRGCPSAPGYPSALGYPSAPTASIHATRRCLPESADAHPRPDTHPR